MWRGIPISHANFDLPAKRQIEERIRAAADQWPGATNQPFRDGDDEARQSDGRRVSRLQEAIRPVLGLARRGVDGVELVARNGPT